MFDFMNQRQNETDMVRKKDTDLGKGGNIKREKSPDHVKLNLMREEYIHNTHN